MEFVPHSQTMQQHTTTIVLSNHKTSITSPSLDSNPMQSLPSPSPPKETKNRDRKKEHKKRENKKRDKDIKKDKKDKATRLLYRLPKDLLVNVCEFLTFEEMFNCTRVCKKLARKLYRILTSHKSCPAVEKSDIKLLLDPSSFVDGVTFYRTPDGAGYCKLAMDDLQIVNKKGIRQQHGQITNAVSHSDAGQLAYHLKQLEHMVLYTTVNGNEIVRVANNWIFFNRKLFIKISDKSIDESSTASEQDDRAYLVDIMIVEANLSRKPKTSLFGRPATQAVESFCQITLDNLHLRTSSTSQESDPVWNEDCSFTVRKKSTNKLQIAMFDYGKLGRHTKLGTVEILLKDLACNVLHDIWQPVQAVEDSLSGNFHVLIHKSPVPKKEVDTRGLGILGHCGPICDSVSMRLEYGDIILISNSEFYTHIAKLGTMSVWDHIAMVVERKGELHLFESTPDGVFTVPLSRRLKFYLQGSTLGVRRLTISRTPEMKKALKHFIKEVDGRPYKQNWMDLVRAWQGTHTSEDLSSIFCSELVAAAYKRMGLLDNKVSSNNFLPVDFALPNNSKVKLVQGRLEKIRMIYTSPDS